MAPPSITDEDRERISRYLNTPLRDRSPDDLLPEDDEPGE